MAVAQVYATNVTKIRNGGSGDNYVSDGFIKTVEKIWLDDYTMAQTGTNTTIQIATIEDNKKITGIEVMIETTASQTNGTISLGHSGDSDAFVPATTVTHNLTLSTITFPQGGVIGAAAAETQPDAKIDGFQMVTSGTTGAIQLKLNNWTMSSGTIKTKVRYT